MLGEVAMLLKRHWDLLEPKDRTRLATILRKSHGRPGNLSASEKRDLRRIVEKIEPRELARGVASKAIPFGRKRRLKRS
ncbi:MAG: hypothetical protein QOG09_1812 [Solirubrobacterales bacterium]|nr:hypothetical protein [Solirubrobacterales bacterium]MDX6651863.1 hypothetical protein [Solirubrobacterales bacterium]MDX6663710.1 hypothetical protein [Solirubrobacterales bacterium]